MCAGRNPPACASGTSFPGWPAHPVATATGNLALAARDYANITCAWATISAWWTPWLSDRPEHTFVAFRFAGGFASGDRRARRAGLIRSVLERLGFRATRKGDLVLGTRKLMERGEALAVLRFLGALSAYTRQLDLEMAGEDDVERFHAAVPRILRRGRPFFSDRGGRVSPNLSPTLRTLGRRRERRETAALRWIKSLPHLPVLLATTNPPWRPWPRWTDSCANTRPPGDRNRPGPAGDGDGPRGRLEPAHGQRPPGPVSPDRKPGRPAGKGPGQLRPRAAPRLAAPGGGHGGHARTGRGQGPAPGRLLRAGLPVPAGVCVTRGPAGLPAQARLEDRLKALLRQAALPGRTSGRCPPGQGPWCWPRSRPRNSPSSFVPPGTTCAGTGRTACPCAAAPRPRTAGSIPSGAVCQRARRIKPRGPGRGLQDGPGQRLLGPGPGLPDRAGGPGSRWTWPCCASG
jgi:hypothetical protein